MARTKRYFMQFNQAIFLTSAVKAEDLPKCHLPEVAFIGRSNVGKSSLINSITNNSKLAKTSRTPGRTQQINFFKLPKLLIVDLPGYGYADVPIHIVKKWQEFNLEYFRDRDQLKAVFILVDSRIGIKDSDLELITYLNELQIISQVVYTKTDKLNKKEIDLLRSVTHFTSSYSFLSPEAIITSSKNKEGINKIRAIIKNYVD